MKIAILGTENSHAHAFATLIRENAEYKDLELAGVYGYDASANQKLLDAGLAPMAAEHPEDFLGKVDGVMITARHGDLHYEYALPYLKAGIPAFIDKPFAIREEYVEEMVKAAREHGALLCGGSSLKFWEKLPDLREFAGRGKTIGGYASAPINMENSYGGFYFYSQHLIEMMFAVFGTDVRAVLARQPEGDQTRMSIIFHYGTFDVCAQYYEDSVYSVSVLCRDGSRNACSTDYGEIQRCYQFELDEFVHMIDAKQMPRDYMALTQPVQLLYAIEQSYREKREIRLEWKQY